MVRQARSGARGVKAVLNELVRLQAARDRVDDLALALDDGERGALGAGRRAEGRAASRCSCGRRGVGRGAGRGGALTPVFSAVDGRSGSSWRWREACAHARGWGARSGHIIITYHREIAKNKKQYRRDVPGASRCPSAHGSSRPAAYFGPASRGPRRLAGVGAPSRRRRHVAAIPCGKCGRHCESHAKSSITFSKSLLGEWSHFLHWFWAHPENVERRILHDGS